MEMHNWPLNVAPSRNKNNEPHHSWRPYFSATRTIFRSSRQRPQMSKLLFAQFRQKCSTARDSNKISSPNRFRRSRTAPSRVPRLRLSNCGPLSRLLFFHAQVRGRLANSRLKLGGFVDDANKADPGSALIPKRPAGPGDMRE